MKILLAIAVVTLLSITNSLTAQNKTITVTIENITSNKGNVKFALYTKDNFKKKPIQGSLGEINNGKTKVVFKGLDSGEYSVICYHDKNNNGKLDFSSRGIPLEDYGASNNNMSFAPPTFEDSKFILGKENVDLKIKF
ncbi:DUF2141 domain-containing protein [uncultured Polaribacter sp.]|uniref:DUF2141 domain-containing protein n=1 Tax=uncultured Polaribacter sp. TaxID=174711 RepID=UPI0026074054|nr:DUF2141 domain-containing protein [uncultured Polaribacter sp.]